MNWRPSTLPSEDPRDTPLLVDRLRRARGLLARRWRGGERPDLWWTPVLGVALLGCWIGVELLAAYTRYDLRVPSQPWWVIVLVLCFSSVGALARMAHHAWQDAEELQRGHPTPHAHWSDVALPMLVFFGRMWWMLPIALLAVLALVVLLGSLAIAYDHAMGAGQGIGVGCGVLCFGGLMSVGLGTLAWQWARELKAQLVTRASEAMEARARLVSGRAERRAQGGSLSMASETGGPIGALSVDHSVRGGLAQADAHEGAHTHAAEDACDAVVLELETSDSHHAHAEHAPPHPHPHPHPQHAPRPPHTS